VLSRFLDIEAGAFAFRIPTSYFPDYTAIKKLRSDVPMYTFSYRLEIKSCKPITYLSSPEDTRVEQLVEQKHIVIKSKKGSKIPSRD